MVSATQKKAEFVGAEPPREMEGGAAPPPPGFFIYQRWARGAEPLENVRDLVGRSTRRIPYLWKCLYKIDISRLPGHPHGSCFGISRIPGHQSGSFLIVFRIQGHQHVSFVSIFRIPGHQQLSFFSISRFPGHKIVRFSVVYITHTCVYTIDLFFKRYEKW